MGRLQRRKLSRSAFPHHSLERSTIFAETIYDLRSSAAAPPATPAPRRTAWPQGCPHRKDRLARRHLPARRLHSHQGHALLRRGLGPPGRTLPGPTGIDGVSAPTLNWDNLIKRKNDITMPKHTKGLDFLMKKNKITVACADTAVSPRSAKDCRVHTIDASPPKTRAKARAPKLQTATQVQGQESGHRHRLRCPHAARVQGRRDHPLPTSKLSPQARKCRSLSSSSAQALSAWSSLPSSSSFRRADVTRPRSAAPHRSRRRHEDVSKEAHPSLQKCAASTSTPACKVEKMEKTRAGVKVSYNWIRAGKPQTQGSRKGPRRRRPRPAHL